MKNSNAGKSYLMRTWARQDEIALSRICEGRLTTGQGGNSLGFVIDTQGGTVFIQPTSQISNAQMQKYRPDEEIDFVQWVVSRPYSSEPTTLEDILNEDEEEPFDDRVYFDTFTSALAYAVLIYE